MEKDQIPQNYKPLNIDTIKQFVLSKAKLRNIFKNIDNLKVTEVGDGNLNLVFFINSESQSICIKQPLPYLRVLKNWPLTLKRSYFESEYIKIHSNHVAKFMPQLLDYDDQFCTIAMEKLTPHIIMRQGMIKGIKYVHFSEHISEFISKTLFFTSDLYLKAADKKNYITKFSNNTELCKITEDLIFTEPYIVDKKNRWTRPYLDNLKNEIENNFELKVATSKLKLKFLTNNEALLHGDLHTGSIMCTETDTKVIDPEFSFYGPMGFDLGALIANLIINYFSQNGHEDIKGDRSDYKEWIITTIVDCWKKFEVKFIDLWQNNQCGDAYTKNFFVNDKEKFLIEQRAYLSNLLIESIGFAGTKMIRRIFGFAHNIDLDWIKDDKKRAECEYKSARLAITMISNSDSFKKIEDLVLKVKNFDIQEVKF